MSEFTESFSFNLANTFTGNIEFLADFFKSTGAAIDNTKPKFENFLLPWSKSVKNLFKLLAQKREGGGLIWRLDTQGGMSRTLSQSILT